MSGNIIGSFDANSTVKVTTGLALKALWLIGGSACGRHVLRRLRVAEDVYDSNVAKVKGLCTSPVSAGSWSPSDYRISIRGAGLKAGYAFGARNLSHRVQIFFDWTCVARYLPSSFGFRATGLARAISKTFLMGSTRLDLVLIPSHRHSLHQLDQREVVGLLPLLPDHLRSASWTVDHPIV